jgi:hypothetical protein
MGLTVHYKLTAPVGTTTARARGFVTAMHRVALRFQQEGQVDAVHPIADDLETLQRFANDWLILPVPREENTSTGVEIAPLAGYVFPVAVGNDCEPLWLGLCQYPRTVRYQGKESTTNKGAGWQLSRPLKPSLPACMVGSILNDAIAR